VKIDKSTILDALRARGEGDKAAQADQELPGTVDSEQHARLFAKFGVDPREIIGGPGDEPGG
jgi:hypothetical protein